MIEFKKKLKLKIIKYLAFGGSIILSFNLKKIIKSITKKSNNGFLFKPYWSLDCLSLHYSLCKKLKSFNVRSEIYNLQDFNIQNYISKDFNKLGIIKFQNLLLDKCKSYKIKRFYYPILDTILKNCSFNYFFSGIVIKEDFFCDFKKYVKYVENYCKNYSTIFLADTAYLENHIIKQFCIKKKKNIFYLNPRGKFLKYKNINFSELNSRILKKYLYEQKKK